jgi:HEAT repeat protein
LIEALNDNAPEVRRAVVESLRRLADPDLMASLSDLLSRERNRQLSSSLIREAIQASGSRTSVAEKFDTSEGDQTKIAKAATASSGGSRESHSEISPANLDES